MTFMGCGDVFYGERDYWPDGSYVTTRWVALLYVPLVPLESLRVRETGFAKTEYFGPIISTQQNYRVYTAGEPHKLQVLFVYLFLVCFVAWMYGLLWAAFKVLHVDLVPKNWYTLAIVVILLSGVALAFLVPMAIRKRAISRSIRRGATGGGANT